MNNSYTKRMWRPAASPRFGAPRLSRGVALALSLTLGAAACSSNAPEQATDPTTNTPATTPSTIDTTDTTTSVPDAVVEEVTVVDPASGYSNTGGGYLGNPIWATGPGNVPIGGGSNNELAIRFVARDSGQSTAASYIIKFDAERPNYQGGDCGILQVTLRPDDGAGHPTEENLATSTLTDPCGGGRESGWLTNQPWDSPAELIGGQPYHLVFTNVADNPDNWVSINLLYRPDDDPGELAFSTGNGELAVSARGSEFWSGVATGGWGQAKILGDHFPAFEIHYADDTSQGISYVGARFGQEITMSAESPSRLRQTFVVLEDTTVTSLHFASDPEETSADATARATLSVAEGPDLVTIDLTRPAGQHWFVAELPLPLSLAAGETYSVVLESAEGKVTVRPLYQAQHDDWISTDQSDWANTRLEFDATGSGGWQPYVGEIPHDLSLYFTTTHADDLAPEATAAATLEPASIALLGDSLISGPEFESQFGVALSSRGLRLTSLVSESGQNVQQLVAALDVEVPTADILIVANTINGEETGAEFEASVRSVVAKLQEANPESRILWVEAFATTAKYDYIVDQRVVPRNAVLNALDAEGLITIVPWAAIADANQWIYDESGDGVHFFGNQQLYASAIIASLDAALRS